MQQCYMAPATSPGSWPAPTRLLIRRVRLDIDAGQVFHRLSRAARAVLLPGVGVGGEHVLDPQPGLWGDQSRVLSLVSHCLVADHAHVVRIAQHTEQAVVADVAFGSARCLAGGQALLTQRFDQVGHGPVAGGVLVATSPFRWSPPRSSPSPPTTN